MPTKYDDTKKRRSRREFLGTSGALAAGMYLARPSVAGAAEPLAMSGGKKTVTLPAGTQISWLRDQFLDFADALNLDALIEPWRPQNP